MSRTVRAFVIDGAAAARRLVREALSAQSAARVVDSASSVEAARPVMSPREVDVVVVGFDPGGAGSAAVAELRRTAPLVPVLAFGVSASSRARAAGEALAAGAAEYVEKPSVTMEWREAVAEARRTLLPRVLALGSRRSSAASVPDLHAVPPSSSGPTGSVTRAVEVRLRQTSGTNFTPPPAVLAIGASTGGPEALAALFGALPHIDVPVLIVQHMPAAFVTTLASRLDRVSTLSVREATHGDRLQPGVAYLAPGDLHMRVAVDGGVPCIALDRSPPECSCRPALDPLFRSVAEVFGARSLAVVLTGMGQDGLEGCRVLRAAGGHVLVQDEATCVVWGMPGHVARAGLADDVLPLHALTGAIVQRLGKRMTSRALGAAHGS